MNFSMVLIPFKNDGKSGVYVIFYYMNYQYRFYHSSKGEKNNGSSETQR